MNFLLFFLFYIICTLILFTLAFILYKLCLKNFIINKITENSILKAFDGIDGKSILDIDPPKEEEQKNEKVYTYF